MREQYKVSGEFFEKNGSEAPKVLNLYLRSDIANSFKNEDKDRKYDSHPSPEDWVKADEKIAEDTKEIDNELIVHYLGGDVGGDGEAILDKKPFQDSNNTLIGLDGDSPAIEKLNLIYRSEIGIEDELGMKVENVKYFNYKPFSPDSDLKDYSDDYENRNSMLGEYYDKYGKDRVVRIFDENVTLGNEHMIIGVGVLSEPLQIKYLERKGRSFGITKDLRTLICERSIPVSDASENNIRTYF